MKFDFKLSEEGEHLFQKALDNEEFEASVYLDCYLGIGHETKIKCCGKVYTKLTAKRKISEVLARKLFGIESVPKEEQQKMVARAIKAARSFILSEMERKMRFY